MLSREELAEYLGKTGLRNMQQVETDYLQHIILSRIISSKLSGKLIFKGGTALQKLHITNRFSVDLDFTAVGEFGDEEVKEFEILSESAMKDYGFDCKATAEKTASKSKRISVEIKGPIYLDTRSEKSISRIKIEVSYRETPLLEPVMRGIMPSYIDMPPYSVQVMQNVEMLAEKIRALTMRSASRDLYDFWVLSMRGFAIDLSLVRRKLSDAYLDAGQFIERLHKFGNSWDTEMKQLIYTDSNVPQFEQTIKFVEKLLTNVYLSIEFGSTGEGHMQDSNVHTASRYFIFSLAEGLPQDRWPNRSNEFYAPFNGFIAFYSYLSMKHVYLTAKVNGVELIKGISLSGMHQDFTIKPNSAIGQNFEIKPSFAIVPNGTMTINGFKVKKGDRIEVSLLCEDKINANAIAISGLLMTED